MDPAVQQITLEAFRRFDTNGDGVIEREELARVLQILDPVSWDDESVDTLMQCTDTNGDGKIQYEEFVHWIQSSDAFDIGEKRPPPPVVDLPSELIFLQGREWTWLRAGSDPLVAFSVD